MIRLPITLNQIRFRPPQILAFGFLGLILAGSLLLMLPVSTNPGHRLSFLDALFEAASAVCVTGLIVTDTATTFTMFGEMVLMVLIQIGGLGFMTVGILVAIMLGRRIGLSERIIAQAALNQFVLSGIVKLIKLVVLTTIAIEALGALLLSVFWAGEMGWGRAFYYGVFHSISAFNNAGFDLMGNYSSLTAYAGSLPINVIISFLFIVGGLGFTVIMDVCSKRLPGKWSLNTKLVLITTLIVNLVSTVFLFMTEHNNPETMGALPLDKQWIASYFHGTVPRTAGFNTIDLTKLENDSLLLTMALMFIGGASGSTAGGIKITTFLLLIMVVWAFVRQKEDINVLNRRIPHDLVYRALAISIIGIALIFTAVLLLELTEEHIPLMHLAFEAVSAFGTVGLSLGVTPELSASGKVIIMTLMFIGRLGPLTIAFALTNQSKKQKIRFPEEKILIG